MYWNPVNVFAVADKTKCFYNLRRFTRVWHFLFPRAIVLYVVLPCRYDHQPLNAHMNNNYCKNPCRAHLLPLSAVIKAWMQCYPVLTAVICSSHYIVLQCLLASTFLWLKNTLMVLHLFNFLHDLFVLSSRLVSFRMTEAVCVRLTESEWEQCSVS